MPLLSEDDLKLVIGRDELTLADVKEILRLVRYGERNDERITYADALLSEAGDYLPPHMLSALVRADITEAEAANDLKLNRAFFSRLIDLLPSLVGFFNSQDNLKGVISCIDDCHNDFHATASSPRKNRQLREKKEHIAIAFETTLKAANH